MQWTVISILMNSEEFACRKFAKNGCNGFGSSCLLTLFQWCPKDHTDWSSALLPFNPYFYSASASCEVQVWIVDKKCVVQYHSDEPRVGSLRESLPPCFGVGIHACAHICAVIGFLTFPVSNKTAAVIFILRDRLAWSFLWYHCTVNNPSFAILRQTIKWHALERMLGSRSRIRLGAGRMLQVCQLVSFPVSDSRACQAVECPAVEGYQPFLRWVVVVCFDWVMRILHGQFNNLLGSIL